MVEICNFAGNMGGWAPCFYRPFNNWEMENIQLLVMRIRAKWVFRNVEDKMIWTGLRKGLSW